MQLARFGDVVTWTVQVKNTGLGSVYDAVFDDAPDPGIRLLSVTPSVTTTAEIKPDKSVLYTVTGEVNACTGLRNSGLGSWSIGNIDATGLVTNPVDDDAYVSYLFEDPGVAVTVEPLGDLQFCGQPQRSLVVTVTNSGGPARELVLEVEKSGSFNLVPASPDWVQAGSVLSYTANGGVLLGGETITFTLDVNFTAQVVLTKQRQLRAAPGLPACLPPDGSTRNGYPGRGGAAEPVGAQLEHCQAGLDRRAGTGRDRLLYRYGSRSQPNQHCHRANPRDRHAAGDLSRRHNRAQRLATGPADC